MPDRSNLLTIREAASKLHLAESSLRRMIADDIIPAHYADREHIAALLQQQRIKGVPGTGVRLIHRNDLAQAHHRHIRGRPLLKKS